jgi:hypothetical protein
MKVLYTTRDGRMTFELEGDKQTDLFRQIAMVQEVFEGTVCTDGKISSDVVNFVVRHVDDNDFYELQCVDKDKPALRYAKKKFGVHKGKDGTMFPKGSWVKYNQEQKAELDLVTGKAVESKKDE